ncbi:MAG: response regulator [Chthoniobacteraceae bacterium]
MEAHFEKRRLDMIELNTKLENAYREIRNLSANLAEARLHAKLAGKSGPGGGSAFASKDEIAAMRRSFQAFSRDQKQMGLLAELETHTHAITDRAMHAGHAILYRVGTAFANLLGDLMEVPDQITQSTLRTLNQGIDFIALLLSDPEIEKSVRLSEARAFVVDDDENTGAMMVDALNLAGIHAIHTLSASAAIAELASTPYDLILLDVHMPDLDGFELSSQVRNMAPHAETPIFFVTGDTSLENRVKSSLRGANEFIAKPFSVQELALKSLKSVITGQLRNR